MDYVSIIIPVYNTEMYLERCLQSVLAQTYLNFEVIIVDDGSTDGSIEICKKFALKSPKIKIIQIANSGVSVARNIGIKNSSGDYICFIDSDDFIDRFLLERVISCFRLYNCDIVKFNSIITSQDKTDQTNQTNQDVKNYVVEVYNTSDAVYEYFHGKEKKLKVQVWSGIYKKELFSNIEFPIGKAYEDSYVTPQLLVKGQKIVYLNYPGYFYFMRSDSLMHTGITESKIASYDIYKILYDIVCKLFPEYEDYICEKWVYQYIYTYKKLLSTEGKIYPNSYEWRKRIYKELHADKKFLLTKALSKSCRKQLNLFLLSPRLFKICIDFMDMKSKRKDSYE
ncbi:hypothetical protein BHF69_05400 [Anaerostipes sp. 992a]|uniref:glycosyltransferase family 2 protein n=1 Tax=Anaerostipes sp. 992a TaxID=1261637 RepID=UPI0009513737|nr:glycosyltransferase family 2 protein [Anaerostipes sp. 992a]OLR62166.1 hypothetical protein BHF69_05400 [Anaerostipes sp. 992a]